MKKVLVITDLSRNSRSGIKFGLQVAAQAGYELEFYHLVEIMKPTSWNDRRFADFARHRIAEVDSQVRALINDAGAEAGHDASLYHIKIEIGTRLVEQVTKYAKKTKANYICLGTRGGGKMKKLLGSNASAFLTTSTLPVIVVPPNYRTSTVTQLMYASDFDNLASEVRKAKVISGDLGADLHVIHYNPTLVISKNLTQLKRKTTKFVDSHTSFSFRKFEIDQTLSAHLNKDIKRQKPSALVLFTRAKRSWFNRLFSPSKSAQIVLEPVLPIIVFRKK